MGVGDDPAEPAEPAVPDADGGTTRSVGARSHATSVTARHTETVTNRGMLPSSHPRRARNLYTCWRRADEERTTGKQLTRVVIEHVSPAVDGGLFPAKTSVGDVVPIEADVFTDGHDLPAARVLIRHEDVDRWEVPMVPLGNDH